MANGVDSWVVMAGCLLALVAIASIVWLLRQRRDLRREIAKLHEIAELRRRERSALQSVIESEAHGVFNFDRDGNITYLNGTAEQMFGRSRAELIGTTPHEVFDETTLAAHQIDISKFRYPKDKTRFDIEGFRKGGSRLSLDISFTEFDAPEGAQLVAFVRDTTDRTEEQQRLLQALHAAEVANRTKSAFLATVSHEVRTPMTAIIGMAELCLRTHLDDTQLDYMTKLHDTSRSLLGILNDILDFSKIEAGELKLERIAFRIDQLLNDVATILRHQAFEQGLELIFARDADVPDEVIGDPMRLKQVLINLCTNAVKFTEAGEIELRVKTRQVKDGRVSLQFTVRDTGIGMTPEQVNSLFKPFSQADSSTSRKYGGTGLGLSISNYLVQMMGGEISVQSRPDQGSTFTFSGTFDIDGSSDLRSLASRVAGDAFSEMTALVVDDNQRTCDVIATYLRNFGLAVETSTTRSAGVRKVLERSIPYDYLVVDEEMPGDLSGEKCIELLGPERLAASKLILLAENRKEPFDEVNQAAVVSKPANPSALLDALMDMSDVELEPRNRQGNFVNHVDLSLAGVRVLLVEDNKINQQVALELLRQAGLEVDVAYNGIEALAALEKAPYDCVLMDIQMPEMDGYEATRRIRQREKYRDLPVLAITANALMDAKEQMLAAGLNDHIPKPIDSRQLLDAIRRAVLADYNSGDMDEVPAEPDKIVDTEAVLDRATGIRYVNGNQVLYDSLLKEFASDNRDDADKLAMLVEQTDLTEAKRLAHTLKGLTRTIGAHACYQQARSIDELLGHNLKPDKFMIGKLGECLKTLCDTIEAAKKDNVKVSAAVPVTAEDLESLRSLIRDMDPAAETRLDELLPSIRCSDSDVLDRLTRELKNFEFDKALISLDEVERLMA